MACIGAAGAELGGVFGLPSDVVTLAHGFALWIALATTYTAQKGVLTWQGRIRAAATLEIVAEMVGFGIAAFTLFQGAGVFALIYGRLAYQTTALILSFALIGRLPRFGLDPAIRRELWVFSGHFLSARILINVRMHFLTLAIGAFLGPVVVGYFRAADRLVAAAFELVAVPGQLLA